MTRSIGRLVLTLILAVPSAGRAEGPAAPTVDPVEPVEAAEVPRPPRGFGPRAGLYRDTSEYLRVSAGLVAEGALRPWEAGAMRLTCGAAWTGFRDDDGEVERLSAGARVHAELAIGLEVEAFYILHAYRQPIAPTHEVLARVGHRLADEVQLVAGFRQRSAVDLPIDELGGFGSFRGLGSGASVEAIEERVQTRELEAKLDLNPVDGWWLTLEGSYGWLTDGNERRTLTLSTGVGLRDVLPSLGIHEPAFTYVYFVLGTEERSELYFDPELFDLHVLLLAYTLRPTRAFWITVEGGPTISSTERSLGATAKGVVGLDLFGVELRARAAYNGSPGFETLAASAELTWRF